MKIYLLSLHEKILLSLLQWSLRTLSASGPAVWAAWIVDLLRHESKLYHPGGQEGAGESVLGHQGHRAVLTRPIVWMKWVLLHRRPPTDGKL